MAEEDPVLKAILAELAELKQQSGKQTQAIEKQTAVVANLIQSVVGLQSYVERRFDDTDQRGDRLAKEIHETADATRIALRATREAIIKGVSAVVSDGDERTRARLDDIESRLQEVTARQQPN